MLCPHDFSEITVVGALVLNWMDPFQYLISQLIIIAKFVGYFFASHMLFNMFHLDLCPHGFSEITVVGALVLNWMDPFQYLFYLLSLTSIY